MEIPKTSRRAELLRTDIAGSIVDRVEAPGSAADRTAVVRHGGDGVDRLCAGLVVGDNPSAVRKSPLQAFEQDLLPVLVANSEHFDPAIERRIAALEGQLRTFVAERGLAALPGFALRGISCADHGTDSLEGWRARGYLSEAGGNFFVFRGEHAERGGLDVETFFQRLYASCGSNLRYAWRSDHPVVLMVKLDDAFDIPASGGNDGITGSFPFSVGGQHLTNLDVGCITRPGYGPRGTGLRADGVPEDHVLRHIGENGLPDWGNIRGRLWDIPEAVMMALGRWVYAEVLETLVSALPA